MQGVYLVSRRQDTLRYHGFCSQQRLLGGWVRACVRQHTASRFELPGACGLWPVGVGVASAGVGE